MTPILIAALCTPVWAFARLSTENPGTIDPAHGRGFEHLRMANIFGPSDREVPSVDFLTLSRIDEKVGLLIKPDGRWCTASLVWKNLILTASHCLVDPENPVPTIMDGEFFFCIPRRGTLTCRQDSTVVGYSYGSLDPETDGRQHDWAILEIDQPLGESNGYFGWRTPGGWETNVTLAGFGSEFFGGEKLSVDLQCELKGMYQSRGLFRHACDASTGDSGAPIFECSGDDCRIVALVAAEYRNGGDETLWLDEYSVENANISVSPYQFFARLRELREKFQ